MNAQVGDAQGSHFTTIRGGQSHLVGTQSTLSGLVPCAQVGEGLEPAAERREFERLDAGPALKL